MILHNILGALAVVSFLSTLWQWFAARRFPLHQRIETTLDDSTRRIAGGSVPAVTLLKPLKGTDEFAESCLRSWFTQVYAGEIQMLFGVANADDPACAVVKKLLAEFPQRDAQLVICPERLGANAKVSKLAQLEPLAKHEIIVVSDADVRVPSDLLTNLVATLGEEGRAGSPLPAAPAHGDSGAHGVTRPTCETVGLVNCFYRFANPTTAAMQWEAIAVNADFWSQVLQGASFRKLDFALGAVMATRRRQLAEIGGFRALADCLADDYQLGNRIARRGYRIKICPVVAECWSRPMGWREVWRHQLRWARTIRVCQPLPYFFSIVSNATLWPLLWCAAVPAELSLGFLGASLFTRILITENLQHRFTQAPSGLMPLLVPVKDLLQAALWMGAFAGNHIEWRGERYRLRCDGTLAKE
ncbi:MAG: glycosyltransferase [Verrucomicrobiota bacterium]